jgi:glycosyltransferase involved in cell wall biosynthesis
MKILVLIHEYPPVGGGGGAAAGDICQGLARRGHEIKVLTAHCKGLPLRETIGKIDVMRLKSLRRQPYRAGFLQMGAYVLAGLWAGLRLIGRWQPDVIHVHFAVPAGALAWMLSRLSGVPYVLTAHLGDVPGGVPEKTGKWFRWVFPFTRPIWRDAKRVVAVSGFTRGLSLRYYRVPIKVIPNGVDLKALDPGELRANVTPRIVFAGRFMEQKNSLALVRVLSQLQDLRWQCVMLGDGPLLEETRREIAARGLADRFTLPGWVTPQEVLDWFRRSDLLFMPSLSEGLPVVGVQALAMGLAVVASRVGGFVDLVNDGGNGSLHEPSDEDGMAESLRRLLSDKRDLLRARQRSRELARKFDLTEVVRAYDKLLREAAVP